MARWVTMGLIVNPVSRYILSPPDLKKQLWQLYWGEKSMWMSFEDNSWNVFSNNSLFLTPWAPSVLEKSWPSLSNHLWSLMGHVASKIKLPMLCNMLKVLFWEDCETLTEFLQSLFLLSWDVWQWSELPGLFEGHVFIAIHRLFWSPFSLIYWLDVRAAVFVTGRVLMLRRRVMVLPSFEGFKLLKHSSAIPNPFILNDNNVDELACERHPHHSPLSFFLMFDLAWPLVQCWEFGWRNAQMMRSRRGALVGRMTKTSFQSRTTNGKTLNH